MSNLSSRIREAMERGLYGVVYDCMKKTAHYWEFQYSKLLAYGAKLPYTLTIKPVGDEIVLEIRVRIPREYVEELSRKVENEEKEEINESLTKESSEVGEGEGSQDHSSRAYLQEA